MASNPDIEVLSARFCINLVFTRVSSIFRSLTSFPYPERFSAPKGARKCLSPIMDFLQYVLEAHSKGLLILQVQIQVPVSRFEAVQVGH